MSNLENRLRSQLPDLADALIAPVEAPDDGPWADHDQTQVVSTENVVRGQRFGRARTLVGAGAAAVAAIGLIMIATDGVTNTDAALDPPGTDAADSVPPPPARTTEPASGGQPVQDPVGHQVAASPPVAPKASSVIKGGENPRLAGAWEPLPQAPLGARSHAVTGWTGSEALFWAGSSPDRSDLRNDGAAYSVDTGRWRVLGTPEWSHPGLHGFYHDGYLYGMAKGGGGRFPVDEGSGADQLLPVADGLLLTDAVVVDGELWAIGSGLDATQEEIGLVRYNPTDELWDHAASYLRSGVQLGYLGVGEPVAIWTGTEVLTWGHDNQGVAVDPDLALSAADMAVSEQPGAWRTVVLPWSPRPDAVVVDSKLLDAAGGPTFLVLTDVNGQLIVDVVVETDEGWRWLMLDLPITDFTATTIGGGGQWLVVFEPGAEPLVVDTRSGGWVRAELADGRSLRQVARPNTVWTGTQLVVWGGGPPSDDPGTAVIWTPPAP